MDDREGYYEKKYKELLSSMIEEWKQEVANLENEIHLMEVAKALNMQMEHLRKTLDS